MVRSSGNANEVARHHLEGKYGLALRVNVKSPRPSTISRTSSSSCQCSLENFLSMTSRFGVSGFTSMMSAVT